MKLVIYGDNYDSHTCSIDLSLSLSEHTFEDLIENQPIGMKLFHEFCQKDLLLSRCVLFLQALDELQLMVDEKYTASARKTFEEYISTRVRLVKKTSLHTYHLG